MAEKDPGDLYWPDGLHTAGTLPDGTPFSTDATGTLSGAEPRHTSDLVAHGFVRERPATETRGH